MTAIYIQRNHTLGHQGIRDLSEQVAQTLANDYQVTWQWQGEHLTFRRSGAKGVLVPESHQVTIEMKLGLMLIPFAPVIRQGIESQLDTLLI